eukprot:9104099-Lingulodinium_polyedra.AAC.1
MQLCNAAERDMVSFWQMLLNVPDLEGKLCNFEVGLAAALDRPVPLLQCGSRRLRGSVVQLEAGQAARLWHALPEG